MSTTTLQVKPRNRYIDILKGICALSVIAIHTACWSGGMYLQPWFYNLFLLLDVPIFFYLSGWGSGYKAPNIKHTLKSVWKLWLRWIYFITVLAVICALTILTPHPISGVTGLRDLLQCWFFQVSFRDLSVIDGSIWFMPLFMSVITVNTFVLSRLPDDKRYIRYYLYLLCVAFVLVCFGSKDWSYYPRMFLFHSIAWVLGYLRMGEISSAKYFILLMGISAVGTCLFSYMQGLPLYDIQNAKFPPSMKYVFVTMFIPLILINIRRFLPDPFGIFSHIGKNAIFYYFAQGISSSLLYYIVPNVTLPHWLLQFFCMLIINLIVAVLFAEFFARTYTYVERLFYKIFPIKKTA